MANAPAVAEPQLASERLSWAELGRFGFIVVQFAAVVFLVRQLEVVSAGLGRLMVLALAGFVVHHALPMSYRLRAFVLLSIAGICLVIGVRPGLWVVLLGSLMIGVTYLPISFNARLAALGALVAGLILLRGWVLPAWVPSGAWPVLGSLFMMRMLVFLYDYKHAPAPPSPIRAAAYFFLLPNVCFPLFPVVDFKTFDRNYFDAPEMHIYQRGLHWMCRGLLQLVLYRLVYHHLTIDAAEVLTAGDLLQYVITAFLLYLRVSGMAHFVIGLLHLFGFRLPETNNRYWLANNFSDLFRRNSIYWKDAMMKLVYYPTFFQLRQKGQRFAMLVGLGLVFFATWALHSWQWFWLRGSPLVTFQDITFYIFLGGLITWQTLQEKPKGRAQPLFWSWRRGAGVCGTMLTLCVLWSYWSADSVGEWLAIWPAALHWDVKGVVILLGGIALGLGVGGLRWSIFGSGTGGSTIDVRGSQLVTMSTLVALGLLANPMLPHWVKGAKRDFLSSLREEKLNEHDQNSMVRGYYEQIATPGADGGQLGQVLNNRQGRPEDWKDITQTELWVVDSTPLLGHLKPSSEMLWRGIQFRSNRWGFRGADFPEHKEPGTYRIAVVGPSDVLGPGVTDDQTFAKVLEARINGANTGTRYTRFEVLNLGISRTSMLQRAWLMENRAVPFAPDLVLFSIHPGPDRGVGVMGLERMLRRGVDAPYPQVGEFVTQHHFTIGGDSNRTRQEIFRVRDDLFKVSLRVVDSLAKAHHLDARFILMREPSEPPSSEQTVGEWIAEIGVPAYDLSDYEGLDETRLRLADFDHHPNVPGHAFIADRLFRQLAAAGLLDSLGVTPDTLNRPALPLEQR